MKNMALVVTTLKTLRPERYPQVPDRFAQKVIDAAGEEQGEPVDLSSVLDRLPRFSIEVAHARAFLAKQAYLDAIGRHPDATLVQLGAGFDTFAGEVAPRPTWEVDLPETQAFKRAVVRRVEGYDDSHVSYVPMDLGAGDLRTALIEHGWPTDRPVFVTIVGVVPYLGADQALALFRQIAGLGTAEVFFDYLVRDNAQMDETAAMIRQQTGEDLRLYIADIRDYLGGFTVHSERTIADVLHESGAEPVEVAVPMSFVHAGTVR